MSGNKWVGEPAPVVSTAAPEPECPICGKVECMTGLPDTTPAQEPPEGLPVCAKCGSNLTIREIWEGKGGNYYAACPKCDPVAPESYKPAEGPEFCGCVCHTVGLFGLMCCPCTKRDLDELVNGKRRDPVSPAATPVTVEAPDGLRKLANWLEGWKLVEDIHANVALQVAIEQLFDAEENGEIKHLLATPKPIGDVEAVARQIATYVRGEFYKPLVCKPENDYLLEGIGKILRPWFAPAGPENKEQK